jgi:hypothetical protein
VSRSAIENLAIAGLRLDPRAVARTSRSRRAITLRHTWTAGDDGRVLDAVRRTWRALARDLAALTGCAIEVYDPSGCMVDEVRP